MVEYTEARASDVKFHDSRHCYQLPPPLLAAEPRRRNGSGMQGRRGSGASGEQRVRVRGLAINARSLAGHSQGTPNGGWGSGALNGIRKPRLRGRFRETQAPHFSKKELPLHRVLAFFATHAAAASRAAAAAASSDTSSNVMFCTASISCRLAFLNI